MPKFILPKYKLIRRFFIVAVLSISMLNFMYSQEENIICTYQIVTNSNLSLPGEGYRLKYYKSGRNERVDLIISESISFTYYYVNDSLFQKDVEPLLLEENDYLTTFELKKNSGQFNLGEHICSLYSFTKDEGEKIRLFYCSEGVTPVFLRKLDERIEGLPIEIVIKDGDKTTTLTMISFEKLYPANLIPYFIELDSL